MDYLKREPQLAPSWAARYWLVLATLTGTVYLIGIAWMLSSPGRLLPTLLFAGVTVAVTGLLLYLLRRSTRAEESDQANTPTTHIKVLLQNQERYRALIENFPNGAVFLFDHDLRYLVAGGADLTRGGRSSVNLEGKTLHEVLQEPAAGVVEGIYRRTLAGEHVASEASFGGQWYQMHSVPILNERQEVTSGMIMAQNITRTKEAEESLRFFQLLVEQTRDAFFWISPEDNFTFYYVNQATCRHFGYQADTLLTLSILDVDSNRTPEFFRQIWKTLKEQGSLVFETEHRRADGSLVPVEVSASLVVHCGKEYFSIHSKDIGERKKQEKALQENELRYRSLFESNQDPVLLVDLVTHQLIDANPAACRTYGYSREELLQLRHVDLSAEPEKTMQMTLTRAEFVPLRFHRKKDGSVFPVELTKSYFQIGGRDYGMGCVHDISSRIEAEQKLLELQQRLTGIIDSAMDAIITIDEASRIVMFNKAAERTFGYQEAEIVGQGIEKLVPVQFQAGHHLHVSRYAASGAPTRMIDPGRPANGLRRNGEEFPVEASISQANVNGKRYFTAILRDITERVRSTQKLEEEKQRLEMAIFSANLGFWDWNNRTGESVYNESWASMLGYQPGELASSFETWTSLIHPDDYISTLQALNDHLEGHSPYYQNEHRLRCRNGQWKWVLASGKVVSRDQTGNPLRTIGTHLDITDRKKSEDEIRKLALVAQKTDNIVIITDAAGIIEWVNDGFTRITEYTLAEAVGRKPGALLQRPGTDPGAVQSMREAILAGQGFDQEVLNYTKSGVPYWVHISAQPVFDKRGDAQRFVAIQTDITERKNAEAQLHFQARVLQSVKDSVIVIDLDGRISYFNQGAEEIFGYTAAEMLGKTLAVLYPESASVQLTKRFQQNLAGHDYTGEWEGRRKDGSSVWVSIKSSLLKDAAGKPIGFLGVSKDVTDRKIAEKKLRESEANLRAIFDASVQMYFLMDSSYRILKFNRSSAEFVQHFYRRDLREGDNMLDFSDSRAIEDFKRNMSRAFNGEKVLVTRQMTLPQGLTLWVEVRYLPTYDASGQVFGVAFVALDITDRKRAEAAILELNASLERRVAERTAQLQSINKELEAFSYSVSHDLRAPLRRIDGFSKAVLEDYYHLLDQEGKEHLDSIRKASQRMGQLIDDLLKLSRVTRGEMQHEPVDLTSLAADIAEELSRVEPGRNVQITIQPGMDAQGDVKLLRIALQNLIENAWKFTARRQMATIEVSKNEQEKQVVFSVRDNGAGFDMKYADKLFGAFQRLHSPSEFEGTGIGLATVHRIIQRHGGRIWAESEVGKGATFYFTLTGDFTKD